jgi:hypothetical protein
MGITILLCTSFQAFAVLQLKFLLFRGVTLYHGVFGAQHVKMIMLSHNSGQ